VVKRKENLVRSFRVVEIMSSAFGVKRSRGLVGPLPPTCVLVTTAGERRQGLPSSPGIPMPLHAAFIHTGHGFLPHGGRHKRLDGGGRELLGWYGLAGGEGRVRTLKSLDGRDFRGT
jgi:hypothetical protein